MPTKKAAAPTVGVGAAKAEAKPERVHPKYTSRTPQLKSDPTEIKRALLLLAEPGQVVELRALNATSGRGGVLSGYFDDLDALAREAARTSGGNVFITVNPVNPALLARCANRAKLATKGGSTGDADVLARRWMLIDIDAVRPSGISATDAEHDATIRKARKVFGYLKSLGWPDPVVADSGNGAHLLYRIDLPADDGGVVGRCLAALAERFDDDRVKVDATCGNPARLVRLYGTVTSKGDATADRPHRLARLLRVPDEISPVPEELLRAIAQSTAKPAGPAGGQAFDLAAWIVAHGLEVRGPDPWQGGRRWIFETCPWNAAHMNGSAYIVQHANGGIAAGCHHNGCSGKGWPELRDIFETDWRAAKAALARDSSPVLVRLADVAPQPINWLWKPRIARGKVTLVAGNAKLGKSLITLDIAARVSRGEVWPDYAASGTPGGVVLLSAEDDLADTIRPRLDAAGADVTRIDALTAVRRPDVKAGAERHCAFNLADDLPDLERAIRQVDDCRLVIIDPISAYLGKTDSHRNSEIRGLLAPLSEMAARHGVAVLAVTHLRKSEGLAIYRAIGSVAFTAAARSIYGVSKDRNDPTGGRRLFLPVGNNLGIDITGLAYRVDPRETANGPQPVVKWESGPVFTTADEGLSDYTDGDDEGGTARAEAGAWLREALSDGPMEAREIIPQALRDGFSKPTLNRAKGDLHVKASKEGFGKTGRWLWTLPQAPGVDAAGEVSP